MKWLLLVLLTSGHVFAAQREPTPAEIAVAERYIKMCSAVHDIASQQYMDCVIDLYESGRRQPQSVPQASPYLPPPKSIDYICVSDCSRRYLLQYCEARCSY